MLGVAGGWRSNEGLLARGRRGERGGLDRGEASGRWLDWQGRSSGEEEALDGLDRAR